MQNASIRMNIVPRDFDEIYDNKLKETTTYKAAYYAAEEEHEKLTGHRKYSDSESYRVSRNRRLKKKK